MTGEGGEGRVLREPYFITRTWNTFERYFITRTRNTFERFALLCKTSFSTPAGPGTRESSIR